MGGVSLRGDCERCAALCCLALAFDAGTSFAIDKPAGVACLHLEASCRCRLHDALDDHGFSGCARYDCAGAGQRVVRLFGARSWRDDAALVPAMIDAFRAMRRVHELLVLLDAARALQLTDAQAREREALEDALERCGDSSEALASFDDRDLERRTSSFLRSLRAIVRLPLVAQK